MKTKRNQSIILAIVLSLLVAFVSLQSGCMSTKKSKLAQSLKAGDSYEEDWKKVAAFDKKRHSQDAKKVVLQIFERAEAEKNAAQIVKALLYQYRYDGYSGISSEKRVVSSLKKKIATAEYPIKPVLQSVLAEAYWQYYRRNRHKILGRTALANDAKAADFETWDMSRFNREITNLYLASLEEKKLLQNTDVNIYSQIIKTHENKDDEKSVVLRPTLYDFLAHRALKHFMNDQSNISKAIDQFRIKKPVAFAESKLFAKANFKNSDKISTPYNALLIFQELEKLHLKRKDETALINVALNRLHFVKKKGIVEHKNKLYIETLNKILKKYEHLPHATNISYSIAYYYDLAAKCEINRYNDTYKFYKRKAFDICEAAITKFPESRGAKNCKSLQHQIARKELSFQIENQVLPNAETKALITYRNVEKVYGKIIALTQEMIEIRRCYSHKTYKNRTDIMEIIDMYNDADIIESFEYELLESDLFHKYSADYAIPALDTGTYVLLMSVTPDFCVENNLLIYQDIKVSNLSYFAKSDKQNTTIYVSDASSGLSLPNIDYKIYYSTYNDATCEYKNVITKTGKSDEKGEIVLDRKELKEENQKISLKNGKDSCFGKIENIYEYNPLRQRVRYGKSTHYFTDRAIYRPGQTVYFKGIILEKRENKEHYEVVVGDSAIIALYDVNNQLIAIKRLKTNEYGSFSGSFILPNGLLNGTMRITNQPYYDDDYGSHYIKVEEYKRPKFEVNFEAVKGSYKLNEMVSVTGWAKAYAGYPINDAKVSYRVVRQASFPYWWQWWKQPPSSGEREIASDTTKTDENGRFKIDFKAIVASNISKDDRVKYNYTVHVDVTDINGETRSKKTQVVVSQVALMANIKMENLIDASEINAFLIETTNLNGIFEATDVKINITPLKTPERIFRNRLLSKANQFPLEKNEYHKRFPYDVYDDENKLLKWEKGEVVFTKNLKTTKESMLEIPDFEAWKTGKYLVELEAKDIFGQDVKWQKYITIYRKNGTKIPTNDLFWYHFSKKEAKVGEYVDVSFGSAAENSRVLIEIAHRKEIIKREWYDISAKQKTIRFKIEEQHRGDLGISLSMVKYYRFFKKTQLIKVPWESKDLKIELSTFRNKLLPGQKEEWQLKISGTKGEKVAAEMLAGMYDASLDVFRPNIWRFPLYSPPTYGKMPTFLQIRSSSNFFGANGNQLGKYKNKSSKYNSYLYDELNLFGFSISNYHYRIPASSAPPLPRPRPQVHEFIKVEKENANFENVKIRKDLRETAFFMPHLRTNADGEIIISFTTPEALTKWKFMALAHTKDALYQQIEREVTTQKDLMVVPYTPRFLRENDNITISSKITNLSENALNGKVILQLFDASTMQPVDTDFENKNATKDFSVAKERSTSVSWQLHIPSHISAITYRIIAKAGSFSDGEENMLPILKNTMLVTESMPLPVRGKGEHKFTFKNLEKADTSSTLKHHKLTLEFSSQPVWYAIQALPYMMEYPYECSEQIFSRYYANSISTHLANSNPKIKKVFDTWTAEAKILEQNKDKAAVKSALLSNLEKNQELKALLLEETPWVRAAKNEKQRKQRLGLLFDLHTMTTKLEAAEKKLLERQMGNGAWTWFSGMKASRYITQHIVTGIGHLQQLGIKQTSEKMEKAMKKAVNYLDGRMYQDWKRLKNNKIDLEKNNFNSMIAHYLYARSFFADVPFYHESFQEAFDYYLSQAQEYWPSQNIYAQAMVALAVHRFDKNDKETPADILEAFRQNATYSDEMGMYFKSLGGWYWYQAPIETQALVIEAFAEIENDAETVGKLKVWLLKQKQTQDWKTTKATAEACYALLLQGTDWIANDEIATVQLGNHVVHPSTMPDLKTEAGTGYYKTNWQADDIETDMKNITVTKTDDGIAWGAVYWQYFEQLDKITHAETPLAIKKEVFLKQITKEGEQLAALSDGAKLKVGDLVRVRVEIRVDRLMEYVHLKDMRAAGFEPTQTLSRYKYQGGIGYYESTKDAATNFFIGYLPKGTYVFEYDLRASHAGNFSNGITTMQCMYAPEFTTHSEGIRVTIE
ncbi:MAG: alpha-2-macroglobulin family protein [Chitinophagales bacterium]